MNGRSRSIVKSKSHTTADKRVVCVIGPNKHDYSETFIRAHIERLPGEVKALYGAGPEFYRAEDDEPVFTEGLVMRQVHRLLKRGFRLSQNHFHILALQWFLAVNQVDAVLAETGWLGVATMAACQNAGKPLIAYFRGADAYSQRILDRIGNHYEDLFKKAAAIIAVSRAMERHLISNLGASANKVHIILSGVDTDLFIGADPGHSARTFLAVGRFEDNKGPHLTLLAFSRVLKSVPDARLQMIGDGN